MIFRVELRGSSKVLQEATPTVKDHAMRPRGYAREDDWAQNSGNAVYLQLFLNGEDRMVELNNEADTWLKITVTPGHFVSYIYILYVK